MSTVISNKIHTARKTHYCDGCGRFIWPKQKYRRLFGSAFSSDPKTELKLCMNCTDIKDDGHLAMMCADDYKVENIK